MKLAAHSPLYGQREKLAHLGHGLRLSRMLLHPRKRRSGMVLKVWSTSQCPLCLVKIISQVIKEGPKECSNYCTIVLFSHASKVMLKILQARLQQYINRELPDVQAGFRKGRGTRDQIANICWIMEKAREFQKKHLFLLYWLCQSLWLCGSQVTVENSERVGNTRPNLPLEKSVCRSGSNS